MENAKQETTGQRFKALRKSHGLTQVEMANMLGISQASITDIENDKNGISIKTAKKVEAVFSYPLNRLLLGEEKMFHGDNHKDFIARLVSLTEQQKRIIIAILDAKDNSESIYPQWPQDPIHAAAIVAEQSGWMLDAVLHHTYHQGPLYAMEAAGINTAAQSLRFLEGINK